MRDATQLLDVYRTQIAGLEWPARDLRVIVCEGDSADDTAARLYAWAAQDDRVHVVQCHIGKPHYPSVVDAERFAVLAQVFNTALDAVDLLWTDYVLFLPADIRYAGDLLRRLVAHQVDIVAPFVFRDGVFYDVWAFSLAGVDLPAFRRPETTKLYGSEPLSMTTVGGTVLIAADVLRAGVRYALSNVDRGLCEAAAARGFRIWSDPTLEVEHPGAGGLTR